MYHTIKEFLDDWKYESESTMKIFSNLTDETLNHKLSAKGRTLGRLAWHITAQIGEALNSMEVNLETVNDDGNYPAQAKSIADKYKSVSDALIDILSKQWKDENLKEEVNVFHETWTKEKILSALIKHQIHHRAQMTVVMRAAGLKVPGIYGPSYEEWQQFGSQPQV
jgi:uncharacterized damage-inducible protein DinB